MAYVPDKGDASAVAGQIVTKAIASGGFPGAVSTDGVVGFADALLNSFGFQSQSSVYGTGTATTNSTSFGNVGDNGATTGWTDWAFTAPVARFYTLHVDLDCYMTVASDMVAFTVTQDAGGGFAGITGQPTQTATQWFDTLLQHTRMSWRLKAPCAAGTNTFRLQWKVINGVGTARMNTLSYRCFTIIG